MLGSIYHRTLKFLKSHFELENVKILASFLQLHNGRHYVTKSVNHYFYCMVFYLSQMHVM